MKKNEQKYNKPKITSQKIKVNFFNTNSRVFDSFDELLAPNVFASSCCGCGGGCFLPGTPITMADGTTKQIEDLTEGDKVLSFDTNKGRIQENIIVDTVTYHNMPTGHLTINNVIKVTGYHKIWVNNREWIRADKLKVGDNLLNNDGKTIKVTRIEKTAGEFDVHNFEVEEETHNYFAGNILAHNGPYS